MYIDKAVVNSYDYPWNKGKQSKTLQLENSLKVEKVRLKKLLPLLEQWYVTVNGEWATRYIELIINVKDTEDRV